MAHLTHKDFKGIIENKDAFPSNLIHRKEEFLAKFDAAIAYLEKDPVAAANLQKVIHATNPQINIQFADTDNGRTANEVHGQVTWSPNTYMVANDSNENGTGGNSIGVESPALILYHELIHATEPKYPQDQDAGFKGGKVLDENNKEIEYPSGTDITPQGKTYNEQYGNVAEYIAVRAENAFAEKHGEPVRHNHGYSTWLFSKDPEATSNVT